KSATKQKQVQIYDLVKWEKVGSPVPTELEGNKRLALSPDGQWIAMRHKGRPTTMHFRGPDKQAVNFEGKGDSGWVIGRVEFASAGRIVTMTQNAENASEASEMRYVVYDAGPQQQISTGKTPVQFHPRYSTFSPGGNYMTMVVRTDEGSKFLVFWD